MFDEKTARKKCEKVQMRQGHDDAYTEGLFWQSKRLRCKDIDMEQLAIGIEIELEHTNSNIMAAKIALDHIAEHDDYYTEYVKWEDMMEKRKRG